MINSQREQIPDATLRHLSKDRRYDINELDLWCGWNECHECFFAAQTMSPAGKQAMLRKLKIVPVLEKGSDTGKLQNVPSNAVAHVDV